MAKDKTSSATRNIVTATIALGILTAAMYAVFALATTRADFHTEDDTALRGVGDRELNLLHAIGAVVVGPPAPPKTRRGLWVTYGTQTVAYLVIFSGMSYLTTLAATLTSFSAKKAQGQEGES